MTDLTAIPAGDVREVVSIVDADDVLLSQGGTTARAPMAALTSYMADFFLPNSSPITPGGSWNASTGTFPSGSIKAEFYVVNTAGTVDGQAFAVGDWLIPLVDNASTTAFLPQWSVGKYSEILPDIYATQADLAASTETARGTGAIWEVKGTFGSFNYIEVATGEDFTTAGGVKLSAVGNGLFTPFISRQFDLSPSNSGSANHAAIQLALDKLDAANGGTFQLGYGSFNVDNDIVMPEKCGLHGLNTYRDFTATATSRINFSNDKGIIIDGHSVSVQRLTLQTTGTSAVPLIRISSGSNKAIDLRMLGLNGGAVEQLDTSFAIASVFEDIILVNGLQGRASFTDYRGAIKAGGTDNFYNRIEANATSGFTGFTGFAAAFVVTGTNHWITNCIGELSDVGLVHQAGTKNRIDSFRADLNWGHGVVLQAGTALFNSLDCLNNGQDAADTYSGVLATGNLAGAISNLRVNNLDSNRLAYAVDLVAMANSNVDFKTELVEWTNVQNVVRTDSFNPASVEIARKVNRFTIPPGTTTLDVGGSSSFVLSAAAAETITAFTGGYFGQEIEIYSESANVTLAHNSGATDPKIFMRSAANLTFSSVGPIRRFKLMPRGGSSARWFEV